MHVDTRSTHVVSAIINLDQDVQEPWRLLILDHSDAEHWLEMQPGDMVLYESAKLLHGRPREYMLHIHTPIANTGILTTNSLCAIVVT